MNSTLELVYEQYTRTTAVHSLTVHYNLVLASFPEVVGHVQVNFSHPSAKTKKTRYANSTTLPYALSSHTQRFLLPNDRATLLIAKMVVLLLEAAGHDRVPHPPSKATKNIPQYIHEMFTVSTLKLELSPSEPHSRLRDNLTLIPSNVL